MDIFKSEKYKCPMVLKEFTIFKPQGNGINFPEICLTLARMARSKKLKGEIRKHMWERNVSILTCWE